ncbi:hypothetical protein SAMN06309944_2082 [Micrococcales bacterium KH10]|nr:hypothetical protein SAMN06309944_2082 [Micrococcales bacterium KH10]
MYGFLWRRLPGPTWLKIIEVAVLLALVVYALFTWGYPWVAEQVEVDPVIGE